MIDLLLSTDLRNAGHAPPSYPSASRRENGGVKKYQRQQLRLNTASQYRARRRERQGGQNEVHVSATQAASDAASWASKRNGKDGQREKRPAFPGRAIEQPPRQDSGSKDESGIEPEPAHFQRHAAEPGEENSGSLGVRASYSRINRDPIDPRPVYWVVIREVQQLDIRIGHHPQRPCHADDPRPRLDEDKASLRHRRSNPALPL